MSTTIRKKIRKNGREISIGGGKILVTKVVLPEPLLLKIPTEAEWEAERLSWGSQDIVGAFGSPLKLAIAGFRNRSDGSLSLVGSVGNYWSNTVQGESSSYLYFDNDYVGADNHIRGEGLSVRLIKDGTFTQSEFNAIASDIITINGLTYGYCYNPTTERVWLDRNLGATQVATSSIDADAYGHLFQWGRYSDGHELRTSDLHDGAALGVATTEQPNQGNNWDGKFITTPLISTDPQDWLTPQNDDLWQGVNGINNPAN